MTVRRIHLMIHEFRDLLVIEDWIWKDHSLLWFCFSHFLKEKKLNSAWGCSLSLQHSHPSIYSTCYFSSKTFEIKILFLFPQLSTFSGRESLVLRLYKDYFFAFGRLAPYLERRCVRFATPAVSRVPRTM